MNSWTVGVLKSDVHMAESIEELKRVLLAILDELEAMDE